MHNIITSHSMTQHQHHLSDYCIPALLAALLLLPAVRLSAQEEAPRVGVYGGGLFISHTADFPYLPGTQSCCLSFTGGDGFGIAGGGLFELPVGPLLLGLRGGYSLWPFDMTTEEGTFVIVGGSGQEGAFQHRLTGSYGTLDIEPTVALGIVGGLHAMAGFRVGLPMSSDYEQYEELVRPEGQGTFLNADGTDSQSRTRNTYTGSIPDLAMQLAPRVGIFWELPMSSSGTLLLVPEVSMQFGLSDIVADTDWKASAVQAGLAVKYRMRGGTAVEEERRTQEIIDTVRREVPILADTYARGVEQVDVDRFTEEGRDIVLETTRRTDTIFALKQAPVEATANIAAAISAVSVDNAGVERPVVRITVEEFSSTLMTPLLPYVFFDENSATIPDDYRELTGAEVSAFDVDEVNSPETLPTYYHLMNIVGRRMIEHPSATITLTGTNQDRDGEAGNRELSQKRAIGVRDYLVRTWGISPERITVEARDLPEKAANTMTEDGAAENRRVEIASSDPRILFPVVTRDTLRRVNPPIIRFRPTVTADAGTEEWSVGAVQGGEMLRKFDGAGDPPATVEWNLERQTSTIPKTGEDLVYRINASDPDGRTATAEGRLGVEQVTIRGKRIAGKEDFQVDRFSLILFDVRSSDLSAMHQTIIDLIRDYIQPNSTVTVTGYTDRLGDAAYNQALAEARATSVSTALGGARVTTEGVGEADLYNDQSPEARLYTRTVEVVIETPLD